MKEIKLKIEGMHCAGCSNRLEKILNNVDGIESAKVSLEEKSADIKYNEEEVELNTILQEIEDAGFKGE
ncbi:MAG: heavy-metal-associated domain-containing protein [Clostridiales bacterium]|jgi:copper chaperone CopZ|nr:merTP family mercury (Hg2+) permease binding protein MerP [Clostridium sp. CAG:567]